MPFNAKSKIFKNVILISVICFAVLLFFNSYSLVEAEEFEYYWRPIGQISGWCCSGAKTECNAENYGQIRYGGTLGDSPSINRYVSCRIPFCFFIKYNQYKCERKEIKKPDFEVVRFAGPSPVSVNESFTYNSTVKNISEADSPKTVSPNGIRYYADGEKVCEYGLWQSSMRAGGTEDTSCSYFKFSSPGKHKIEVCIDPDNEITEANENNNCQVKIVSVETKEGIKCTDSDGGKDYYVQGITRDIEGKFTDYCKDKDSILYEYYCKGNFVATESFKCPHGCENGACVREEPKEFCDGKADGTNCGTNRWCAGGKCQQYYWKAIGHIEGRCCSGSKTQCSPEQYGNIRYGGKLGSDAAINRYVKCGIPFCFFVKYHQYKCEREDVKTACIPNAYFDCYDNDVYWFDSCGNIESKKDNCGWRGCQDGYCRGTEPNDPVSGTISASPTTVAPLEDITLTIEAQDDQRIAFISVFYQGKWHAQLCLNETSCTKSWTFKEIFPGKKQYYGFIMSYQPIKGAFPTFPISINIPGLSSIPFPTGLNLLGYIPEWKIIGPAEVEVKIDIEPNDPVSGTISASPTTTAPLGDITITIGAEDEQGVALVAAFYQGKWHSQLCLNKTSCAKSWTFKEIVPGNKKYYGFVMGYKVVGGPPSIFPLPINIPGLPPFPSPPGLNLLNFITEWKIVGPVEVNVKTMENDPVSGTISAVPTTAFPLEDITLTIEAQDNQGLAFIAALYQGKWHAQLCLNKTSCKKSWTFKEMLPGNKKYYGFVLGYQPIIGLPLTFPISINISDIPSIFLPGGLKLLGYTAEWKLIGPAEVNVVLEKEPNDPVSGTLSVSKTKVKVGEDITFTIKAQDDQGVDKVCLFHYGSWDCQLCAREEKTSCAKTWTFSESAPGEYKYSGYVYGFKPDGSQEESYTKPESMVVKVEGEGESNDPISGTLSASKTKVKVGEDITLTITAQDDQGVDEVDAHYQDSWHAQFCDGKTSCAKTWTFSESATGTYEYFGYVFGYKPDESGEGVYTDPYSITVEVGEESEEIVNCQESYGSEYWCGSYEEWDMECEEKGEAIKLPENTICKRENETYQYCITCKEKKYEGYSPGEFIVKFKENPALKMGASAESFVSTKFDTLNDLNEEHKIDDFKEIFSNIYKFKTTSRQDLLTIIEEYKKDPNVEYAEPNYIRKLFLAPNDSLFSEQWAHQNTQAESGWDTERGSSDIVIAIIDTGVNYQHEDLSANMIQGYDFVDIDTDLYINDGFKLISGEDYTERDNDPSDFDGHGTHCAGISAAVADNNLGVAGVCHNCKLMPVRAGFLIRYGSDDWGCLEEDDIIEAIIYAADNGADVINMSFGGGPFSNAEKDAIDYAHNKGVVLVAAAGNGSTHQKSYPAGYNNVIAVAATNRNDKISGFSNYGNWVDIAAPGVDILSTVPSGYIKLSGTSMSAPYVAGLAGLVLSKKPDSPESIKKIIKAAADDISSSKHIDGGRINVARAITAEIVSYTVILNSGTYKTCNQICNEELGGHCLSIGTDPDGTDGKWYAPGLWLVCNHLKDGTCDREMVKSLTGKECDGILTQWTNCRCAIIE